MNFQVVMNAWSPPEDSPSRWPTELVCALAQQGHQVEVLAGLLPYGSHIPENVTMRDWPHRHRQGDLTWHDFHAHAAQLIRGETQRTTISFVHHIPAQVMHLWGAAGEADHPQGVHDHWPWPINWLVTGRNLLRQRRAPLHELETSALRDPMVRHIISVSPAMTKHLRNKPGITAQHIIELRPGIETIDSSSTFNSDRSMQPDQLRRQLNIEPTATVMLWPTPGMPRRWFDAALMALKTVMLQHRSLQVILAGELVHHHHESITAAGLRDRVGLIPTAGHMHALLPAVDFVFNLTPAPAGVSRHTLMSLANGVPVITHAFDGAQSWLTDPDGQPAGLIIDQPDKPVSISQGLQQLMSDHHRNTLHTAAVAIAPNFTMNHHTHALLQALR